ncbi:MAG: type III pantothenate kinase [Bacteroidaceae bacterium]|nr:type III pantothenate kinase [Bacteroidaceae bacterium]
MNLILDIGNTVSKYYFFDGDMLESHGRQLGHTLEFIDHLSVLPEAVIVSSVVDLSEEAEQRLQALPCPVERFTAQTPIPLANRYRTPSTLGTDRLAAAIGAWTQHPHHPLLIIDAGSCITFDFVTQAGEYVGGNIAPGLHARLQAIGDYFPRLPLVEAEGDVPELGYDTETAIRAGVIEGLKHEIEGYIQHFSAKYPELFVFLTGGDDFRFDKTSRCPIFADKFLVPHGLNAVLRHLKP